MRALICNEPRKIEERQIKKPESEQGCAIIKITRIGICGTDLHAFEGTQPYFSYPRILGHELAGEIVEISGTDEFKKGELVTFIPYLNCGNCIMCAQGKTNCCINIKVFGVHIDGGMTEYLSVPSRLLLKVKGISPDAVALIEPLAIAAHAIRRGEVTMKDNVIIAGVGPIGVGIAQFAKMKGANVIVVDVNEDRLAFSREQLGIEKTVNASQVDAIARINEMTNGDMASVVFDATGNLQALQQGFKYMGHGSKYVLVGLQLKDISFSHPEFHKREGTLMSSRNATRDDFENVIDAITSGKIDPLNMVTHHTRFENVKEQFPQWLDPKNKVIKVLVELD
jgi:2-desacetyl-2-hydroxyethyl bacteriochlorophyllide A dehydrogenase